MLEEKRVFCLYSLRFVEGGIMLQFTHKTLIRISGGVWLAAGALLLNKGLRLLMEVAKPLTPESAISPLFDLMNPLFGGMENTAICAISVALIVGFFKGRYVLIKSAHRVVSRIRSFPEPAPLQALYSKPYLLLLSLMMLIGLGIRFLGVPNDIRGVIDVAIGSALINGAGIYFRISSQIFTGKEEGRNSTS